MSPWARVLAGLIVGYRYLLSPVLPATCRYTPTCSAYALQALRSFGAFRGSWLAVRRICRCHPWGGAGVDEVPEAAPGTTQRRYDAPARPFAARHSRIR